MEHLSAEALARLVDEAPGSTEEKHLSECDGCSAELEDLRSQTRMLGDLPDLVPPGEEWESLRSRLVAEGLLEPGAGGQVIERGGADGALLTSRASRPLRLRLAPVAFRAAAALCVFLVGAASGGWLLSHGADGRAVEPLTVASSRAEQPELSLEETEALLVHIQDEYLEALALYRDRLEESGEGPATVDPLSRFTALDRLLEATEAAVREAPADPFLNGLLVSTMAEREATLRGMTLTPTGIWY